MRDHRTSAGTLVLAARLTSDQFTLSLLNTALNKTTQQNISAERTRQLLTHRFSNSGCDVWSNEAGDGTDAVTDTHQRAGVLRRNVHVIDEVAAVHEAAHSDSQH